MHGRETRCASDDRQRALSIALSSVLCHALMELQGRGGGGEGLTASSLIRSSSAWWSAFLVCQCAQACRAVSAKLSRAETAVGFHEGKHAHCWFPKGTTCSLSFPTGEIMHVVSSRVRVGVDGWGGHRTATSSSEMILPMPLGRKKLLKYPVLTCVCASGACHRPSRPSRRVGQRKLINR